MEARTRQFLERQRLAHLATADAGGEPHVIPVCFALAGDSVYIAIDEKPKKSEESVKETEEEKLAPQGEAAGEPAPET